jgi:hypothetical protein
LFLIYKNVLVFSLIFARAGYQSQGMWLESDRLLVPVRAASLSYLNEYLDKNHDS